MKGIKDKIKNIKTWVNDDYEGCYSLINIVFNLTERIYNKYDKTGEKYNGGYDQELRILKEIIFSSKDIWSIADTINKSGIGYDEWKFLKSTQNEIIYDLFDKCGNRRFLKITF